MYDEFERVSAIEHESKCAKVHGVVSSLSPMKESSTGSARYFAGALAPLCCLI